MIAADDGCTVREQERAPTINLASPRISQGHPLDGFLAQPQIDYFSARRAREKPPIVQAPLPSYAFPHFAPPPLSLSPVRRDLASDNPKHISDFDSSFPPFSLKLNSIPLLLLPSLISSYLLPSNTSVTHPTGQSSKSLFFFLPPDTTSKTLPLDLPTLRPVLSDPKAPPSLPSHTTPTSRLPAALINLPDPKVSHSLCRKKYSYPLKPQSLTALSHTTSTHLLWSDISSASILVSFVAVW